MPDITNDFDNNPNTDKRKQRDEEVNNDNLQPEQTKSESELLEQTKSKEFSIPIFAKLYDRCNLKIDELNLKNDKLNAKIEKLKLRKQIDKLTNKKEKLINKLKALNEWSDKFESVKTMPDKEADNIISKSCQNIVDEFTNNPQALKKQADVIVSSAAKAVFEENYLKNAEMSIEDDYDSIDGIINNGNKQEEYDKAAKTPNKEHNAEKQPKQPKKSLISRSQIKQNADKIAHTHNEQRNNTKSKEQEL